jgi:DNA adenine methylase
MRAKELPSPIKYVGGKSKLVAKLLGYIPLHRTYCEVFGGGASLLFAKKPSPIEIYNDIDENLVNLFRVLRDEKKFELFYRKVALTLYSRREFEFCADTYNSDKLDDVERAWRYFVVIRQAFGGMIGSCWGFSLTRNQSKEWFRAINKLPVLHKRLMNVQIECNDFRKIFETYDSEDTFFYADPPYVSETRKNVFYDNELSDKDHEDLVKLLLKVKGKVMLSGYKNDIYKRLEEAGWKRFDFRIACSVKGRTKGTGLRGNKCSADDYRTESIWINYKLGLLGV